MKQNNLRVLLFVVVLKMMTIVGASITISANVLCKQTLWRWGGNDSEMYLKQQPREAASSVEEPVLFLTTQKK